MHQNKIPRPAENRIIRIGDGAVFLIFLQIRCVAPSMANTAIERKSGANPACKSVRPNSVDSAVLSAVARIIATVPCDVQPFYAKQVFNSIMIHRFFESLPAIRRGASDSRFRCAFVCIAARLFRVPAFCAGSP